MAADVIIPSIYLTFLLDTSIVYTKAEEGESLGITLEKSEKNLPGYPTFSVSCETQGICIRVGEEAVRFQDQGIPTLHFINTRAKHAVYSDEVLMKPLTDVLSC